MLALEQIAAMSNEQLEAAKADCVQRADLNRAGQRFAAGVTSKQTRGGSKVRTRRVAKTDWKRLRMLEDQGRELRFERNLIDEEIKRRANAEEARA